MPQASVVAAELRRLADSLDKEPEVKISRPIVAFYHGADRDKPSFLAEVSLFPRPLTKTYDDREVEVSYKNDGILVYAKINRNAVCKMVKPAEYECEPLLSQEELDEVGK